MISRPPQITEHHLRRKAIVYLRQSSEAQVREHTGSAALQRDLAARAVNWGWSSKQVDVLDDDLGISGSIPGARPDFESLLRRMAAGEIGIVFVSDISRLTRNPEDLVAFGQTARRHHVLLVHSGQTVDFTNPTDEFVGFLMGLNAVRDNRARAAMGTLARRKKAEQGKATTTPPVGYVKRRGGLWSKDRDPAVRQGIELIFTLFEQLGSVRKVVRRLREQGLKLARKRGRVIDPTTPAVYCILRHPAYAGRYVFGLTKTLETRTGWKRVRRPASEHLVHDNHHAPYISLERWIRVQERLQANRATAVAPAGKGDALAQGHIRCGIHDHSMYTIYPVRGRKTGGTPRRSAQYVCRPGNLTADPGLCLHITAARIDAPVERELLRVLAPPSLPTLEAAIREARHLYDAQMRLRETIESRAEQEVVVLERLLRETPTKHTHSRQRLHRQLETAAAALEDVRARHRLNPLAPPITLDAGDLGALQRLVRDLDRLWHHPSVTADQRKAVLRTAITAVRVTPQPPVIRVELQWIGGAITVLELGTPEHGHALVQELYAAGWTDGKIVDELRRRELVIRKGTAAGRPYTVRTIRYIVRRRGLQRPFDQQAHALIHARLMEGGVSQARMAAELNEAGVRHRDGRWTAEAVRTAVSRLRAGQVPGFAVVPPTRPITPRVLALAQQDPRPEVIAAQLNAERAVTRFSRPVTVPAVKAILRRARARTTPPQGPARRG